MGNTAAGIAKHSNPMALAGRHMMTPVQERPQERSGASKGPHTRTRLPLLHDSVGLRRQPLGLNPSTRFGSALRLGPTRRRTPRPGDQSYPIAPGTVGHGSASAASTSSGLRDSPTRNLRLNGPGPQDQRRVRVPDATVVVRGQTKVAKMQIDATLFATLADAVNGGVHQPGSVEYATRMSSIIMADSAMRQPAVIVTPEDENDIAAVLKLAAQAGVAVVVRGGSHSAFCTADDAILIDTSVHMKTAEVMGERVRVGAGATMGAILAALAPVDRVIPIGAAPSPGMGLALQGGVGEIGRHFGLTLDHLVSARVVLTSGEVVVVDDTSVGELADLWWALRGAGPNFGVVTQADFRTHLLPQITTNRFVLDVPDLAPFLAMARILPRTVSMSMLLNGDPTGEPRLLIMLMNSGAPREVFQDHVTQVQHLITQAGATLHFGVQEVGPYQDQPPFAATDSAGNTPPPEADDAPISERVFPYSRSGFLPADADLATVAVLLGQAFAAAPNPMCRIDIQHIGGAVGDVESNETAFWNRDAEWSVTITGAWFGPDSQREACTDWADETAAALRPHFHGGYVVEARPDHPSMAEQVRSAFGENLPRLQALKRQFDPTNTLRGYYVL